MERSLASNVTHVEIGVESLDEQLGYHDVAIENRDMQGRPAKRIYEIDHAGMIVAVVIMVIIFVVPVFVVVVVVVVVAVIFVTAAILRRLILAGADLVTRF